MKMRSSDCNGRCDGQWNTHKDMKHSKYRDGDEWLYLRGFRKNISFRIAVQTGNIFELDSCGQKRAVGSTQKLDVG